jgi:leader peptidase (prepilin peptidase)/N-methyltransferase
MNSPLWLTEWVAPLAIGACIGSFLNVCIYRIPLGKSIIAPASRCAACGIELPWKYNIPILAWFLLRGRCACKLTRLSFRYPLVEALTAVLFLWLWNSYPPLLASVYILMACGLVIATFVDIDLFIIPDRISLGGIVVGLILSTLIPELHGQATWRAGLVHSAVGMVTGGGILIGIAILGALIFRKEAMGMGDIKLLAAMGAFLGWQAVLFIIAASSIVGALYGILQMLRKQTRWGMPIPFGPFLALAALAYVLGAHYFVTMYFDSLSAPLE